MVYLFIDRGWVETMIQLHLGCGNVRLPNFINSDIIKTDAVDIVMDARYLTYEENSVDLIYASHILDHFKRYEINAVLTEWNRVLKPCGVLRLSVSDFEKVALMYRCGCGLERLWGSIVGGQKDMYDHHGCVFDYDTLKKYLIWNGFCDIHRYKWENTIHKDFDDFSQAYIPHMDKKHGVLMSLNVEAKKCL